MSGDSGSGGFSSSLAPQSSDREEQWRHFDNSVSAVSFGFVATAILISMFLIMAIFERFLRPRNQGRSTSSSSTAADHGRTTSLNDLEAQGAMFHGKLGFQCPPMTIYANGVSVLMPGHDFPTFIAHPAPPPCEREPAIWPLHHNHHHLPNTLTTLDQR